MPAKAGIQLLLTLAELDPAIQLQNLGDVEGVQMKIAAYLIAATNIALWCGWTWLGLSLLQGIRWQHVIGYPTISEWIFLSALPSFVLTASVVSLFFWRSKIERLLGMHCLLLVMTVVGGTLYLGQFSGGV